MTRLLSLAILGIFALTGSTQAQTWGNVKGKILWKGTAPEQAFLNIGGNADKAYCESKGKIPEEEFTINPKNNGVQWVFVWIAPAKGAPALAINPALKDPAKKDVVIDQPLCQFFPHAVALQNGQRLFVKNSAKIAHNFKWTGNPSNNNGNVLLPPGGEHAIEGLMPDRFPWTLECNVHPWMRGMMMVYDHPYFAVTDADGNFEIKGVPTGDCQLMIRNSTGQWLGGAKGKDGKSITVEAGGTDVGSYKFP